MGFQKVTHVLFDMDGLLLNTEDLYTICFQQITGQYGKNFTFDLKCKIMGQQSRDFANTIIQDLELPISVDEFLNQSKALFEELFKQTQLMPGAKRLIHHLHKHNIPIGLATSSSIESYRAKSANHTELFELLPWKTWGSSDPEVKRGKPYPDTFLVAASRFPDKPEPAKRDIFYHYNRAPTMTKKIPGAKRLIHHLHKHNIPIGLATSSSIESYRAKSANHTELFELLPWKTWGSSDPEVKRGKPYPDTFLVAASRFPDKPEPAKVLVFEDSPNGVRSGRSAGMQVVMVPDPRYDRSLAPDPTLILDSLEQFKPELFGLPAFEDSL